MNVELILVGLGVGVLVGLTGVGGGSIMTPLLIALNVPALTAVGTDLLYSVPTKLFGAFLHHRQKTVNWVLVRYLCIGGVPAAIVGCLAIGWMKTRIPLEILQSDTKHAIGFAILVSAAMIIISPWLLRNRNTDHDSEPLRPNRLGLIVTGVAVGLIVSITSIGSGAVTLPLLALVVPSVGLRYLVGSDIAFAAILVPVAFLGRLSFDHANLPLAANLIIGSMPGVWIGSRFCNILHQNYLRPAVGLTLLFVGMRMV